MSQDRFKYTEHLSEITHGFHTTDSTSTGPTSAHDDLVWVGYGGMEGKWLTPGEALAVAAAITRAACSNLKRHGADPAKPIAWVAYVEEVEGHEFTYPQHVIYEPPEGHFVECSTAIYYQHTLDALLAQPGVTQRQHKG